MDIGTHTTGRLTPLNAYVTLSRSRDKKAIRLLRDFDNRLFTQNPTEYLRNEDQRLERLNLKTMEALKMGITSRDGQTYEV